MAVKITPIPKKQLKELYNELGSQRAIADRLGVSQRLISMWMIKYGLPRRSNVSSGPEHPRWKGGVKKTAKGRVKIWAPDHSRADNINWEEVHGPIPKGYVIHHLNGIKDDDRVENLVMMKSSSHHPWLVLHEVQKRLRKLEKENRKLKRELSKK